MAGTSEEGQFPMGPEAVLERLGQILRDLSVRRGEFVLSSGRKSSYYLDCRRTTLHPEGAWLAGRAVFDLIRQRGIPAEAIGGLTLGADPIVAAVAVVSHLEGAPIPAFIVRKAAKSHGAGKRIEGTPVEGRKVVVVDDVVTTAGSTREAIEAVREAGGEVTAAVCLVDREEGGAENLTDVPFHAVFRKGDLLDP